MPALIREGSWPGLPIFELLEAKGGVPEAELYQVFNMGIGMVLICSQFDVEEIAHQVSVGFDIGKVVEGERSVRIAAM